MLTADEEKRLRGLENKVLIATGAALVFAAWFGVANLYYIPNSVQSAVDKTTSGESAKSIKKLLDQAKSDSDQIAQISNNGTITIGKVCFVPRHLTRCHIGGSVFVYMDAEKECAANKGQVIEDKFFLAQCP